MTLNSTLRQIGNRLAGGLATRRFRHRTLGAAAPALAFLLLSHLALAANPTIRAVTFAGSSEDLLVRIFGTGFGAAPSGVPCRRCSTPYLGIADGRGYGCELYNIASWSDSEIVFSGFQGNPGDSVLVTVRNLKAGLTGITAVTIPRTVSVGTPVIKSVSFAGAIGPNLEITIDGSGFGAAPPGLPFSGDLPFFSLIANPFAKEQWQAGYTDDSVFLKYGSWSVSRILIIGFGGTYGSGFFTLHPNEALTVAVADTGTCGLEMNAVDRTLGPTAIGAVWGGHLR